MELETGAWGMIAGDADGDGEVLAVDGDLSRSQWGQTRPPRRFQHRRRRVQRRLGAVDGQPGCTTHAVDGATLLLSLGPYPARANAAFGAHQTFTVAGNAGPVSWATVKAPSGGTLSSLTATSAVHTAGTLPAPWTLSKPGMERGGWVSADVNVISAGEVARTGKAIVIAGRKSLDDPLWPVTDYLGGVAYNTLLIPRLRQSQHPVSEPGNRPGCGWQQ